MYVCQNVSFHTFVFGEVWRVGGEFFWPVTDVRELGIVSYTQLFLEVRVPTINGVNIPSK